VIPTAAANEAAGRLAANLAEYIRQTCQVSRVQHRPTLKYVAIFMAQMNVNLAPNEK
jgi:hypothetical protein